jgi:hypothetical protein
MGVSSTHRIVMSSITAIRSAVCVLPTPPAPLSATKRCSRTNVGNLDELDISYDETRECRRGGQPMPPQEVPEVRAGCSLLDLHGARNLRVFGGSVLTASVRRSDLSELPVRVSVQRASAAGYDLSKTLGFRGARNRVSIGPALIRLPIRPAAGFYFLCPADFKARAQRM